MVTLQHYAVKTIENIGSQAGEWAQRFASSEVVSYLVTMWQGSKNDNVRSTAASTLSRLVRHSPTLLGPTLEKYSLKPVILGKLPVLVHQHYLEESAGKVRWCRSSIMLPNSLHGCTSKSLQNLYAVSLLRQCL